MFRYQLTQFNNNRVVYGTLDIKRRQREDKLKDWRMIYQGWSVNCG